MRRGFARVWMLPVFIGGVGLATVLLTAEPILAPAPAIVYAPAPFPRFGTNPGGSTWRLSDLKPGSELREIDLRGCDWRGVRLPGVRFERVDFRGADLSGATLTDAIFRSCDLREVRLEGADLSGATLKGGYLGADFRGALLDTAAILSVVQASDRCTCHCLPDLRGGVYDSWTRWPAGFDPEQYGARLWSGMD